MKTRTISFSKVIKDSTKNFTKIKKQDYLEHGKYKIIDQGQDFVSGYTNKKEFVNFDNIPLIIFGDHTKIFKYIDFPIAIGADGVKVLTVDSKIADTKYVYYYLRSLKLPDGGYSRHFKYLKTKKIVLPEDKQYQIKIANLLTQVETLITKREESIKLLDELLKSIFLDMFGDPVLNPKSWDYYELSEIASSQLGKMLSKKSKQNINPKPYLRNANVRWGHFDLEELYEMDFNEKEMQKFNLIENDLLVCEGGEVGRCAIWKNQIKECYFQKALHRIRVNNLLLKAEYLQLYFYWMSYHGALASSTTETTFSHLTGEKLKKLKIPLPPKPLQDKFATIVQQVETTKKHYQKSLDELNQLFGSLSQKAFKGELDLSKIELLEIEKPKLSDNSNNKLEANLTKEQLDNLNNIARRVSDVIKTNELKTVAKQVETIRKLPTIGDAVKRASMLAQSFKSFNIPTLNIEIPKFYKNITSFDFNSISTFNTFQQTIQKLHERVEHIYQMLEDIPQIKEAMECGVLSRDDFLELPLRHDYEYSQIKRIIMNKLSSGELRQHFDESSEKIKLVKPE